MAARIGSVSRGFTVILARSWLPTRPGGVLLDCRRFIRGLRRRPVAVLHPGGEQEAPIKPRHAADKHEPEGGRTRAAASSNPRTTRETPETRSAREQLGGRRFEKARPGDKRLAKVVSFARYKAFRDEHGQVLLEGRRLICDALAAGALPQTLFFSRVERLCELPLEKLEKASLVKVKFDDIKIWSDLVTPQGVIAIFSKPDPSHLAFPKDLRLQSVPLFLICDNVRDAGNLGTILRCAAASGCDRVLLTKGCADAWEPKVLRAAMGAHFRLPVFSSLDWDEISEHLPKLTTVHVADDGGARTKSVDLVCNRAERKDTNPEEYVESDSDEDLDVGDDEYSVPHVECKVYYENWAQRSTALIVSGEISGQSLEALRMVKETDGRKLFIPLAQGVNSLSPAMTASILLFEGRRQMMRLVQKAGRRRKAVI